MSRRMQPATRFLIMTRSAQMPNSCWGRYVRVGVVEVEADLEGEPRMLSPRAKGVVRVVQTWERLNSEKGGKRDAHRKALAEAEALVAKLEEARR